MELTELTEPTFSAAKHRVEHHMGTTGPLVYARAQHLDSANLQGGPFSGYHQVPVQPQDVPKKAVNTPFGLLEFLRMPFGLKNVSQAFQRLIVFVYLDDILMASTSTVKHVKHL